MPTIQLRGLLLVCYCIFSLCVLGDCAALKLGTRSLLKVPISQSPAGHTAAGSLRVLQYNILADGLSGLRSDLGGFSRVSREDLLWSARGPAILRELVQFDADVITLQECDHYCDFLQKELHSIGYTSLFAPKPASACLEVSNSSDGCAVFLRSHKVRVISTEHLTWDEAVKGTELRDEALSRKLYSDRQNLWKFLRRQNQVALINVCEISSSDGRRVPVVIATTHLKASKTARGERLRYWEAQQLLSAIERTCNSLLEQSDTYGLLASVPVILTGDLNACPASSSSSFDFNNTVYPLIKRHPLGLRSVMNDDLLDLPTPATSKDGVSPGPATLAGPAERVWTTWKARFKLGKEVVARSCVDYILYGAAHRKACVGEGRRRQGKGNKNEQACELGVRASSVLDVPSDAEVGPQLLPNARFPSDHIPLVADLQITTGAVR